jgi:Zn-dependent protease with chaperone function
MVGAGFATPLAVATGIALAAGLFQSALRPQVAARTLAVTCVAVAATVTMTLLVLVVGALAEVAAIERWSTWCPLLGRADKHVPVWLGLGAGVLLLAMAARVVLLVRDLRRVRRLLPSCDGGVLVIESSRPTAYALPGRRGGVVVSRGMLDALKPAERTVMWAHERSHLVHRHDLYVLVADLSTALVPPLGRLAGQVRYATERWADEDAAVRVDGDRGLVARAIARAALATVDHRRSQLALAEMGVGQRVQALVEADRTMVGPFAGLAFAVVVVASTLGGSGIQLHHLVGLLAHLCGGG